MSDPIETTPWWSLSNLPFAARLTLACFLLSVGVGYCSALVQLHFQHAAPGDMLPQTKDVVRTFHGPREAEVPRSKLELLITAEESLPWNGSGQMTAAFTTRSEGWKGEVRKRGEDTVRAERLGERDALVAWIHAGAPETAYNDDAFVLRGDLAGKPITAEYAEKNNDGLVVRIKSILEARCVRCHMPEGDDANAGNFRLDSYAALSKYLEVEEVGPAMSLEKLAQTTHVHLLAFSMLYMLTGLLLALTRYPAFLKIPLAVTPLLVQVFDIACWWLARLPGDVGVRFAEAIPITGGIVALGLVTQITLTLFDLFGRWGKLMLVLLFVVAGFSASVVYNKVIQPHIASEAASAAELKH
jgi:mono/diheme cytochrome c family protein